MPPIHPGEILLEEFLEPLGLSQYRLAKDISVAPRRINEIVHGKRAISADTALRLSRYFGTTDRFWLNLQTRYALELEKDRLGRRLEAEVQVLKRASRFRKTQGQRPYGCLRRRHPEDTGIHVEFRLRNGVPVHGFDLPEL